MKAGNYLKDDELDEVRELVKALNMGDSPLQTLSADISLRDANGEHVGHVQSHGNDGYVYAPLGGVGND